MDDSTENLALSSTFIWRNGEITHFTDPAATAIPEPLLRPGSVVDSKYKVIGLIAHGGMGAVYKVHHVLLQKDMALKTFLSQGFSSGSWQRFQREAQAIAKLKHKNIVDVFDFGIADGHLPYYTMALLDGNNLADLIDKSGPLAQGDALKIFGQVAEALAHAHRQNIVHRDIKPDNIILLAAGPAKDGIRQAKLLDFGIAKLADYITDNEDQSRTQAGTVFGSPLYMSPEQSFGLPTDHRTDIYSFGCALFETLTGKPPFRGNTALITMLHHQRQAPPSLKSVFAGVAFSSRLESTIAKLLAKNPENRYQNFDDVVEELKKCYKAIPPEPLPAGERKVLPRSSPVGDSGDKAEIPTSTTFNRRPLVALFSLGAACLALIAASLGWPAIHEPFSKPLTFSARGKLDTEAIRNSRYEDPKAPKIDARPKLYYIGLEKEADGVKRIFNFPPDEQVGSLVLEGAHKVFICKGKVTVPAEAKLVLVAGDGPLANPQLFRRFGPNDLYGIQLAPQMISSLEGDWSDRHIEEIGHLTGLRTLDLSRSSSLTPAIAKDINKLKNLKQLNLAYAHMTGKIFVALTALPQLQMLEVSGIDELTEVWPYLSNSNCALETLVANYCHLSKQDLDLVGKFKNLKVLSLTFNGITNYGLVSLAPASHLQSLNLANNNIDDGSIKYIARYRALKDVSLTFKSLSAIGIARLQRALPTGCTLNDLDTQQ